jgi:Bacterial toxin 23
MLNYDDGKRGGSLGTNIWSGFGGMKEFGQRTGMLSFRNNDFRFSYENDGTPFQYLGLGDAGDSYRSAAGSIGIGDFSVNMNLLTGLRNKESYRTESVQDFNETLASGNFYKKVTSGIPMGRGPFGENYKHGFVHEKGPKYRYGGLTVNHGGISVGFNSEWVRHAFQNVLAHHIIQPQRQFPMLSSDARPVHNISNQALSKFTIWGQ